MNTDTLPLVDLNSCRACGRETKASARFCAHCGSPLERGTAATLSSEQVPPGRGRHYGSRFALGAVLAIGTGVMAYVFAPTLRQLLVPASRTFAEGVVGTLPAGAAAEQVGPILASPDRGRVVYVLENTSAARVIDTDRSSSTFVSVRNLLLSKDGRQLAYCAEVTSLLNKMIKVVLNGESVGEYEEVGDLSFSNDGNTLGFCAKRQGRWFTVVGGRENEQKWDHASRLTFLNARGDRYAYSASAGGRHFVIAAGQTGPSYADVGLVSASPDGAELAYVASHANSTQRLAAIFQGRLDEPAMGQFAVFRGQSQSPFSFVQSFTFGGAGNRLAYVGNQTLRQTVVVDGAPGEWFEDVSPPVFNATGRSVAFLGMVGNKWRREGTTHVQNHDWHVAGQGYVVLNGQKGYTFGAYPDPGPPVFSGDGEHLAYIARHGDKWSIDVDGRQGRLFEGATSPRFNESTLAYIGMKEGRPHIVVGDDLRPLDADRVFFETFAFSPDGTAVGVLALRGNKLWHLVARVR